MNSAVSQSVIKVSFTREGTNEVFLRRTLFILCGMLVVAYVYLASASVFHAIQERSAERSIEEKRTQLAKLEQAYFLLSRQVTLDTAGAYGLSKVGEKHFVNQDILVGSAAGINGL